MNRCAGALAGALIIAYAPGALAAYGVDMNPTLPEAVAIYKRGDKKAAFKAMLYLARDNNAQAQGILGLMYSNGDGVTADQAEALRDRAARRSVVDLGRRAAGQGLAVLVGVIGAVHRNLAQPLLIQPARAPVAVGAAAVPEFMVADQGDA